MVVNCCCFCGVPIAPSLTTFRKSLEGFGDLLSCPGPSGMHSPRQWDGWTAKPLYGMRSRWR